LRELPLQAAEKLADVATQRHSLAAAYVLTVFFIVPGICVAIMSALS
jgi:sodium-dependent phosphate cotransporter